ncbi:hypothetical protein JXB31_02635 [Candidatus Woesearchaeota archaeon]|nr:hypothetical protein [Candidatus Woesearchaeota archaeon]
MSDKFNDVLLDMFTFLNYHDTFTQEFKDAENPLSGLKLPKYFLDVSDPRILEISDRLIDAKANNLLFREYEENKGHMFRSLENNIELILRPQIPEQPFKTLVSTLQDKELSLENPELDKIVLSCQHMMTTPICYIEGGLKKFESNIKKLFSLRRVLHKQLGYIGESGIAYDTQRYRIYIDTKRPFKEIEATEYSELDPENRQIFIEHLGDKVYNTALKEKRLGKAQLDIVRVAERFGKGRKKIRYHRKQYDELSLSEKDRFFRLLSKDRLFSYLEQNKKLKTYTRLFENRDANAKITRTQYFKKIVQNPFTRENKRWYETHLDIIKKYGLDILSHSSLSPVARKPLFMSYFPQEDPLDYFGTRSWSQQVTDWKSKVSFKVHYNLFHADHGKKISMGRGLKGAKSYLEDILDRAIDYSRLDYVVDSKKPAVNADHEIYKYTTDDIDGSLVHGRVMRIGRLVAISYFKEEDESLESFDRNIEKIFMAISSNYSSGEKSYLKELEELKRDVECDRYDKLDESKITKEKYFIQDRFTDTIRVQNTQVDPFLILQPNTLKEELETVFHLMLDDSNNKLWHMFATDYLGDNRKEDTNYESLQMTLVPRINNQGLVSSIFDYLRMTPYMALEVQIKDMEMRKVDLDTHKSHKEKSKKKLSDFDTKICELWSREGRVDELESILQSNIGFYSARIAKHPDLSDEHFKMSVHNILNMTYLSGRLRYLSLKKEERGLFSGQEIFFELQSRASRMLNDFSKERVKTAIDYIVKNEGRVPSELIRRYQEQAMAVNEIFESSCKAFFGDSHGYECSRQEYIFKDKYSEAVTVFLSGISEIQEQMSLKYGKAGAAVEGVNDVSVSSDKYIADGVSCIIAYMVCNAERLFDINRSTNLDNIKMKVRNSIDADANIGANVDYNANYNADINVDARADSDARADADVKADSNVNTSANNIDAVAGTSEKEKAKWQLSRCEFDGYELYLPADRNALCLKKKLNYGRVNNFLEKWFCESQLPYISEEHLRLINIFRNDYNRITRLAYQSAKKA